MKVYDVNDCPDKKTETDTNTDESSQSGIANARNGIRDATLMIQEGVHDG